MKRKQFSKKKQKHHSFINVGVYDDGLSIGVVKSFGILISIHCTNCHHVFYTL